LQRVYKLENIAVSMFMVCIARKSFLATNQFWHVSMFAGYM